MSTASAVAATGIQAADIALQVNAHNLANQMSAGFRGKRAVTTNLVYQDLVSGAGGPVGAAELGIPTMQAGSGVRVAATLTDMKRGTPKPTKNQFDVYINGPGYLQVDLGGGRVGYTRAGHLKVDENGLLRTASDYPLMDNIQVDLTLYSNIIIDKSGRVFGVDPMQDGTARQQQLGQLTLWNFTNPQGLEDREDTVFIQSPEAGASIQGNPGENALGTILQGYVESSTVEGPIELVNAINIQRYSSSCATMLRLGEEMDRNNLHQIASIA